MSQKILFVTPPFTQLNTPYPATSYLKGFLNTQQIPSYQCDLGIEVILQLFSAKNFEKLFQMAAEQSALLSDNAQRMLHLKEDYIATIDEVIAFLQNHNPTLAYHICEGDYLPEAARFAQVADLEWAFGTMGMRDKARHLATLYLEDISDLIVEAIDPHFGFSRYAERISTAASSFDELEIELNKPNSFIDNILLSLLDQKISTEQPSLVAFSVPFPGNLYCALRAGGYLKKHYPHIKVAMGGGFPNTELRDLTDPRVFNYLDYITLDDGETPLLNLLQHLDEQRTLQDLKRTLALENGKVSYFNGSLDQDFSQQNVGVPDYSDLALSKYLSVIEVANPMHRLWSDGRWNKLTLAHGCYWGKCTFCDISLDYIKRYEPSTAQLLCDKIEAIIQQTGENGFHFVDEAAPPALMKELAIEILRRKLTVVWWTNIRFEKSFSYDLCQLLKASGCIAVSGGLEVASDRLLSLIQKGVTVAQVAKVADNFTRSGIMVHAYLMYGFPTQTAQETIDALEMVRQLFMQGVVQSGFWHQFAMTAHSPVGLNPDQYKVESLQKELGTFANNDRAHHDKTGIDHGLFSEGLRKSLFNYMHGIGFDLSLQKWFDFKVPKTSISPNFIEAAINQVDYKLPKATSRILWLGPFPQLLQQEVKNKGKLELQRVLHFYFKKEDKTLKTDEALGKWLCELLPLIKADKTAMSYADFRAHYEQNQTLDFELFWHGKIATQLREFGLLVL